MILASNISMRFGKKVLFEDVSVKFNKGSRYGLIGANGVGKSTFMKILTGQLEPSSGKISFDKNTTLGYLKQDHFQYDKLSVIDTVYQGNSKLWKLHCEREKLYDKSDKGHLTEAEADYLYGELETLYDDWGGYTMEADAVKLLIGLGITEEFHNEKMSATSGGLKLRTLLAQVLFGKPDILMLDEPTNHLDMNSIIWLVEFLKQYQGTIVVISHDRFFLNSVSTHTADLDFQELRLFPGNYDQFMTTNAILLEQMQKENKKLEKRASQLKSFINRFSANASKAKQATARQKELEKLDVKSIKPSSRISPYIRFEPITKIGEKVVEVKNITQQFDEELLFENFSCSIGNDEKIAIIGTNGVGKTTLTKILTRSLVATKGKVILGETIKFSIFAQDFAEILTEVEMSAIDWLGQFATKGITEQELRAAMGRMLFSKNDVFKPIKVLSGGEKARLILAKMILEGGNVLILDEPTNHLDLESIEALNYALDLFPHAIIFVSHDKEFVNSIATRIFEVSNKKITDYRGNLNEFEKWKAKQV